MPATTIILVAAALVAVFWLMAKAFVGRGASERRTRLRQRFGPEYDRLVERYGVTRTLRILDARSRRVKRLHLRQLSPRERDEFAAAWLRLQEHFQETPGAAIGASQQLVQRLMKSLGYPNADLDQRSADLSVDHGEVVQDYRAACALDHASRLGHAHPDELRAGVKHYRALFSALLAMELPSRPPEPPDTALIERAGQLREPASSNREWQHGP